MKKISVILFLFFSISSFAQHKLEKIWETDSIVAIPESVLPDFNDNVLYVSLIDGGGWDNDGKGGVAKLGMDGTNYNGTWVSGLSAPKGMGIYKNELYVADFSDVVVINTKDGNVKKKIKVPNSKGLNDISIAGDGTVYVSDSRDAKIYRITEGKASLYLDNVENVNGVKSIGDDLYIGSGKNFVKADKNKNITKIAEVTQNIDGIEPVGNGDFLLTSWSGYIYYVTADGQMTILLDAHENMNTADLGYDAEKRILYVPTFNAKRVIAYRLI